MNKNGVKTLAEKIPMRILFIGIIISAALMIKSAIISAGEFTYYSHLLSGYMYEAAVFILAECSIGAIVFEYLRLKKKPEAK